ncbi:zinc finger protein 883-like [Acanthaster planci]|uniref:Zinc finger protein 883-like n=1 Tax=Acanthaster planci TaxID=133434 RepID=A0A8B7Y6F6_ACAPL|nr:zinc finger protein 883-like [Acanthaster planci]
MHVLSVNGRISTDFEVGNITEAPKVHLWLSREPGGGDRCIFVFADWQVGMAAHQDDDTAEKMLDHGDRSEQDDNWTGSESDRCSMESEKGPFFCEVCNVTLKTLATFKYHESKTHTGIRPFVCDVCQKAFKTAGVLKDHIRIHTGEKPFKCGICCKRFRFSSVLRVHRMEHDNIKPFACRFCHKAFRSSSHCLDHERTHTGEKPFLCSTCGKAFKTKTHLREHCKIHNKLKHNSQEQSLSYLPEQQPERSATRSIVVTTKTSTKVANVPMCQHKSKRRVCKFCSKRFKTFSYLRRHESTHKGERPYICITCDKTFQTKRNLKGHRKIHTRSRPSPCSSCTCDERSRSPVMLQVHEMDHDYIGKSVCKVCNKSFSNSSHIAQRRNTQSHNPRSKASPFLCEICNRVFIAAYQLQMHLVTHSVERPFACDVCNKTFKMQSGLTSHKRMHIVCKRVKTNVRVKKKTFKCAVCKEAFTSPGQLQEHQRVDTGEERYPCGICDKMFSKRGAREIHHMLHRKGKAGPSDNKAELQKVRNCRVQSRNTVYMGDVCDKSFECPDTRQEHRNAHNPKRPFVCEFCDKSFTTKGNLQTHVRIHSGEKPFKCDVCDCSFSFYDHLKRHKAGHNSVKPFVCKFCAKGFYRSWALKAHKRTHTGERPLLLDVGGT